MMTKIGVMLISAVLPISASSVLPFDYFDPNKVSVHSGVWGYFQVAPVGWNYVSSKDGVDTFFRSEGKPAMDTMMLCSGLDFQFHKVAANQFCAFPKDDVHITVVFPPAVYLEKPSPCGLANPYSFIRSQLLARSIDSSASYPQ